MGERRYIVRCVDFAESISMLYIAMSAPYPRYIKPRQVFSRYLCTPPKVDTNCVNRSQCFLKRVGISSHEVLLRPAGFRSLSGREALVRGSSIVSTGLADPERVVIAYWVEGGGGSLRSPGWPNTGAHLK